MNYKPTTPAHSNHLAAARILKYAGFNAKLVKNPLCEQQYQVDVKCTSDQAKELQLLVCQLLKDDTINIVEIN